MANNDVSDFATVVCVKFVFYLLLFLKKNIKSNPFLYYFDHIQHRILYCDLRHMLFSCDLRLRFIWHKSEVMEDKKKTGLVRSAFGRVPPRGGPFGNLINLPLSCLCTAYKCTYILFVRGL